MSWTATTSLGVCAWVAREPTLKQLAGEEHAVERVGDLVRQCRGGLSDCRESGLIEEFDLESLPFLLSVSALYEDQDLALDRFEQPLELIVVRLGLRAVEREHSDHFTRDLNRKPERTAQFLVSGQAPSWIPGVVVKVGHADRSSCGHRGFGQCFAHGHRGGAKLTSQRPQIGLRWPRPPRG